jgi:hypothetical protein
MPEHTTSVQSEWANDTSLSPSVMDVPSMIWNCTVSGKQTVSISYLFDFHGQLPHPGVGYFTRDFITCSNRWRKAINSELMMAALGAWQVRLHDAAPKIHAQFVTCVWALLFLASAIRHDPKWKASSETPVLVVFCRMPLWPSGQPGGFHAFGDPRCT